MEVVGAAESAAEAIELFRRHRPDVTLMDLRLRGANGVDVIRSIRGDDPAARIIVLTMYEGDEDIYRALQAGAAMYLTKDTESHELIHVVREVHAGRTPVQAGVQARLRERASHPSLTARETEVLKLVALGMANKQIAAVIGVSPDTVIVHLRNVFAKLDVTSRTAAVGVAARRGIIEMP